MELYDFISNVTKSLQALHKPLLSEKKFSDLQVTQYSDYTSLSINIHETEEDNMSIGIVKTISTYELESPEEQRRILDEIDKLFPI